MIQNAFIGTPLPPTPRALAQKLGTSKELWNRLVKDITRDCGITEREWKSYSPKAGWSLRLKRKKRNIVYLAPCEGCFQVAFIFGEAAMKTAKKADFTPRFARLIADAPRYPEGRAIRFEVTDSSDAEAVKLLAKIKVEN